MDRGAWQATVYGVAELDMTEQFSLSQVALVVKNLPANSGEARDVGSIPGLKRSPGVGYSSLLQYSCLENSMDRGAYWAVVHSIARSHACTHVHTHTHTHTELILYMLKYTLRLSPFHFSSGSTERLHFPTFLLDKGHVTMVWPIAKIQNNYMCHIQHYEALGLLYTLLTLLML